MEELIKEGLLWLAMIAPAASGVIAAVVVVFKGVRQLKEAVQTFTASQEVKKLVEQLEKQSEARKLTEEENEQLHKEIRLLVDQLRRVTGYADYKLGGGDNDGKV